jgi:hypothetical protein
MFQEKLRAAAQGNNSLLCIGLDPDPELMAHPHVPSFLQEIVEATSDPSAPNRTWVLRGYGLEGMQVLLESCALSPSTSRSSPTRAAISATRTACMPAPLRYYSSTPPR